MDQIEHLLAVKTRLTTIKGYAQLLERDIDRTQPIPSRLGARIAELNNEISRLIDLVTDIELAIQHRDEAEQRALSANDNATYRPAADSC